MLGNIHIRFSRVSTYTKEYRPTFDLLCVCSRKVRLKIFTVRLPTISRDSASALEFLQATRAILIVSVNLVTRRTSGHAAFVFHLCFIWRILFGEFISSQERCQQHTDRSFQTATMKSRN